MSLSRQIEDMESELDALKYEYEKLESARAELKDEVSSLGEDNERLDHFRTYVQTMCPEVYREYMALINMNDGKLFNY